MATSSRQDKALVGCYTINNIDTSLGELQSLYILNKMRQISTAASGDNNVRNNDLHRLHDIKGILNIWGTTLVKKSRDWHSFQEISSPLDNREGILKAFNYADDRINHMLLKAMIARKCFDFQSCTTNSSTIESLKKHTKHIAAAGAGIGRMLAAVYKCAYTNKSFITMSSSLRD